MEDVEEVSHGRVVGIIYPPPDIRAIVDKTAQFVGRNGRQFESKIAAQAAAGSTKFNFLRANDPYNAYYESKVEEFANPEAAAAKAAAKTKAKAAEDAVEDLTEEQLPAEAAVAAALKANALP